jgi:hypothetical protein
MRKLLLSVTACVTLAGCQPTTSNTATERAICQAWEDTLILPSRQDTRETAVALNDQVRVQAAACR